MIDVNVTKSKVIFQAMKDTQANAEITSLTQEYITLLATEGDTTTIQAQINAIKDAQGSTDYLAATSASDLLTYWPPELGENPFVPPTPSGILFTGRGSGLGPQDLNVSYYVEFNSDFSLENQTELYVPGTDTIIPYNSGGPGRFDSFGNCFNVGDYLIQIRDTYSKVVIAEFEVPLNPAGQNVSFPSSSSVES